MMTIPAWVAVVFAVVALAPIVAATTVYAVMLFKYRADSRPTSQYLGDGWAEIYFPDSKTRAIVNLRTLAEDEAQEDDE